MARIDQDNKPIISLSSPSPNKKESGNESKIVIIKQIAKRSIDILQSKDSLEQILKARNKREFVSPLQINIRNKRWKEFSSFTTRSLFILKMKLNNINEPMLDCIKRMSALNVSIKILRALSSLCRSCLYILKGLERFPEEIKSDNSESSLLKQTFDVTDEIIFIVSMLSPKMLPSSFKSKIKPTPQFLSDKSNETTIADTINISSSDWNSDSKKIFHPDRLKKSLFQLAKERQLPFVKNKSKRQRKTYKIINPLKVKPKILPRVMEESAIPKLPLESSHLKRKPKKPQIIDTASKESVLKENHKRHSSSTRVQFSKPTKKKRVRSKKVIETKLQNLSKLGFHRKPKKDVTEEDPREGFQIANKTSYYQETLFNLELKLNMLEEAFEKQELSLAQLDTCIPPYNDKSIHPLDIEDAIKKASDSLDRLDRDLNPEYPNYGGSSTSDVIPKPVPEEPLEAIGEIPLSMHQQIMAHKEQFWNKLLSNNDLFLLPPQQFQNNKIPNCKQTKKTEVPLTKSTVKKENKLVQVEASLLQANEEIAESGEPSIFKETNSYQTISNEEESVITDSNLISTHSYVETNAEEVGSPKEDLELRNTSESVSEESHLKNKSTSEIQESIDDTGSYSVTFSHSTEPSKET